MSQWTKSPHFTVNCSVSIFLSYWIILFILNTANLFIVHFLWFCKQTCEDEWMVPLIFVSLHIMIGGLDLGSVGDFYCLDQQNIKMSRSHSWWLFFFLAGLDGVLWWGNGAELHSLFCSVSQQTVNRSEQNLWGNWDTSQPGDPGFTAGPPASSEPESVNMFPVTLIPQFGFVVDTPEVKTWTWISCPPGCSHNFRGF